MSAKGESKEVSDRRRHARAVLASRSPLALRFFGRLFERDLKASFHAVRISGVLPSALGPLVVYANHPSWWDGELFIWLLARVFTTRRGFGPIEAAMLDRYRFFGRLGAFGVAPGFAGAAAFLSVGEAVLASDNGMLLLNAEGRFRDVRDRPLRLASGLAHLAKRVPDACFVPLAIECVFWDERRPNLLLRFGEPLSANTVTTSRGGALSDALSTTMDALAVAAAAREPAQFAVLLAGNARINPFYDAWRRAKSLLRGRRFDPAHRADSGVTLP